jgi:hypothetical protein
MNEMQEKWKEEWEKTSKHRFRSPEDMQYAFAYYYYVIHRHKAKPPDVLAYIKKEVREREREPRNICLIDLSAALPSLSLLG